MRFLFLSLALSALYACQPEEQPSARAQFEMGADKPGTPVPKDWRYAKYRFTIAGKEDVLVAVRVAVNEDNEATDLEVKDLTEGREDRAVETATLMGDMDADGNYAFSGTSQLPESGTDYGGKYSGTLTVTNNSVADDGCCGEMEFTSTEQGKLTLTGTKEAEDFGADDWEWEDDEVDSTSAEPAPATPAACEDFKLVFSGLKDVRREETFDLTVAAKTCDDGQTDNFNGNEVTLHFKIGTIDWTESSQSGEELDTNSTHTYENLRFNVSNNSKKTYQYKASVEKDGDSYTAVSDTFDLNPITSVDDGSCEDDNYSLEVSKQPMDSKVDADFTFEVTLKCDGMIVNDITKDKAASAPITRVQYKKGSTGNWTDSSMIKDNDGNLKEVAGALKGGKKEFTKSFNGVAASLQYRIGVTINGEEHIATTDTFDITQ